MSRSKISNCSIFCIIVLFILSSCNFKTKKVPWVKIGSSNFLINNKEFRFLGANAVYLVFYDELGLDREKAIKYAKDNNIKVLRIFLDWGWGSFSDYDEIIDLASRYNIYLIFTLTDCCCSSDYSNIEEYFQRHAPYCNPINDESRECFKKRIKEIILHKNSINKRLYRDEPTIFAWDIANELEYWRFDIPETRKWISEISRYIKELDPNHLVTINFATSNIEFDKDTPFYNLFNISELDFISFSFYPLAKEYKEEYILSLDKRITSRINRLLSFKRPIVIQEFGFSTSGRLNFETRNNPVTSSLYYSVIKRGIDSAFSAGVSGVLFWGWGIAEERKSSMWWALESHTLEEEKFSDFIRNYKIPYNLK